MEFQPGTYILELQIKIKPNIITTKCSLKKNFFWNGPEHKKNNKKKFSKITFEILYLWK
jgi:hypothetical protein